MRGSELVAPSQRHRPIQRPALHWCDWAIFC